MKLAMFEKLHFKNAWWLLLSVLVIALDQWTKILAETHLLFAQPVAFLPHFNFTLLYNEGAAFSFLGDAGGWQRWFFTVLAFVISAILFVWLLQLNARQRWLALALSLVIGGAIGNVIDRIVYGHVIDFIDWYAGNYHWPAFNIADSAICVGAVILLLDGLFQKGEEK